MIQSKDRSGWIGASDTAMVMANWRTPTWHKWWATKLGITSNDFTTTAMLAGTHYEHPILDALGIKRRDRQIRIRRLRLRVNLDGEDAIIHEVKTYLGKPVPKQASPVQVGAVLGYAEDVDPPLRGGRRDRVAVEGVFPSSYIPFKVTKAYWKQAQVEMFAARKPLVINAYRLTEAEYSNFFLPIDPERLSEHPIAYDPAWVKNEYLPRLRILAGALRKGVYPDESLGQDS